MPVSSRQSGRIDLMNHQTLRNDIKRNVWGLVKKIEVSSSGLKGLTLNGLHSLIPNTELFLSLYGFVWGEHLDSQETKFTVIKC